MTDAEILWFTLLVIAVAAGMVALPILIGIILIWREWYRANVRDDFMREQHAYEGEVIGDASLLDRPEPRNPFRQKHPREEEPMGM